MTDILNHSKHVQDDDFDDLGAGVRASFPVLSYRGKAWWIWHSKQELALVDNQGTPVNEIGVALLKVPPNLSKRYFGQPYRQGERSRPSCWSDDGKKPHPSAIIPDQPDGRPKPALCAQCFMDTIGSAMSNDKTRPMKACADYKRVAIRLISPSFGRMLLGNSWSNDLVPLDEVSLSPMLLNIPQASLQNLKDYGKFLTDAKTPAVARLTWIGFSPMEAFPKLTFRHGQEFADDIYLHMRELRNSEETSYIVSRDNDVAEADPALAAPAQQAQIQAPVQQAPQPIRTTVSAAPPIQTVTPIVPPPSKVSGIPTQPVSPPFVPTARPIIRPVAAPISAAVANPTPAPLSLRPVAQPVAQPETQPTQQQAEGLEYPEANIPSELDSVFSGLKHPAAE